MTTPKFYTSKDPIWHDAKQLPVPFSRVLKPERLKEKAAEKLYKKATALSADLAAFHTEVKTICTQLYEEALQAMGADAQKSKGNFTWYNFDRSFKVEIDMKDRIEYDPIKLEAAKQKFDDYIAQHVAGNDDLIITLIKDAFTNTKGKVDNKKIQTLVSYKAKFSGAKYALWHAGCDLLIAAATVVSSKRYTTFSVRQDDGSYQQLNLNFSSL